MEEEKKISPGVLIGAGVAVLALIIFVVMRIGGGGMGTRPANDVSAMIPKVQEKTPPPPPGFTMPVGMNKVRGAK